MGHNVVPLCHREATVHLCNSSHCFGPSSAPVKIQTMHLLEPCRTYCAHPPTSNTNSHVLAGPVEGSYFSPRGRAADVSVGHHPSHTGLREDTKGTMEVQLPNLLLSSWMGVTYEIYETVTREKG